MIKILTNFWVGVGRFLLIIHAVIALILYLELHRFWKLGLTLTEARRLTDYYAIFNLGILKVLLIGLIIPVAITVIKYLLRNRLRGKLYETTRIERWLILIIHAVLVVTVLYLYWLYPYMQLLSGHSLQGGELRFSYHSEYYSALNAYALPTILVTIVLFILSFYGRMRISGKEPHELITHYNLWLALAYPEGKLYPSFNRKLNFNAGAISPEIRLIREATRKKEAEYQKHLPGSRAAALYLQQTSNRCREKIFELLRIDNSVFSFQIEFHTGTSRAIELAIARMDKPLEVIVSPYEHPSEVEVIQWLASQDERIAWHQLVLPASALYENWEVQELELRRQLESTQAETDKNVLFLISEVHYATGMVIPIKRLMDTFRSSGGDRLTFLIDASHSVGNYQEAFGNGSLPLTGHDSYVFGSHKWLLSSEPCGAVLTSKVASLAKNASYDTWKDSLPTTTIGFAKIGSFLSSLELILNKIGLDNLLALSKLMRDTFISSIGEKFQVVAQSTNQAMTNMIAIKPHDGYQWKTNSLQDLSSDVSRMGINCQVIDAGDDSLWIRLTFLYFIGYSDIKSLKAKLEDAVNRY